MIERNFKNPLTNNLDHILDLTRPLWENLRNQNIFITGGTGFVGSWLLESFIWANTQLNLNSRAVVLTRDPTFFSRNCPHLFHHSSLDFLIGNINDFIFPDKKFFAVIHAANPIENNINAIDSLNNSIEGTKRILEFSAKNRVEKFLLISSGAVYGKSFPFNFSEDASLHGEFNSPNSSYAVSKCLAEHLCALYASKYSLDVKIARCFTFAGEHLPLHRYFALTQFFQNALNGLPILIKSDGKAMRSYLSATDMTIWLWTILFNGQTMRPYNVGSEKEISIAHLAEKIAYLFSPKSEINFIPENYVNGISDYYVPSVKRVTEELGLKQTLSLDQTLLAMKQWYSV